MDDRKEQSQPTPETGARESWVQPEVSRLNAESAQAGPGDSVADATEFS